MMKISSTKKAAILATVLSGFVLSSSVEAANKLGVVTASDYVTSHMGALEGSFINSSDIYAVKSVITGLNRDPAVYNTVDPVTGKSSLYIRQYNYSTTNLQNSYAFDAQGDWQDRSVGNTSGAVNAHDVARYNNYVYVASYDEGTVGIAKVEGNNILDIPTMTVNLKQDLKDYEGITFEDKNASLHGEGVVIVDGALYVIANVNPKGGYTPYDPSYLMKYVIQEDGSLSYDGCTTMGKNTDSVSLNVYNNYMLATAIGGYQYYGAENSNAETSINVATLHPEYNYLQSSRKITLPENLLQVRDGKTIPKSEFRSLKVMPNGTAYVMTYNIGRAGKNVDVTVYQTTISNLLSKNPENWKVVVEEKAAPGWFGRLDAEQNTKRLWVQVGNKLDIYTDGATNPLSFGTDSFAANKMYEELYTWDIISTDVIPEGGLVNLHITKGNVQPVTWKEVEIGKNISQIKNETYKNIETKDNLISLNQDVEGNLTNNVLAGIYADGENSNIIANDGLQIQVDNNIASPVGIYAGNGGSVKFTSTSGNLDILTKTLDGGNTLTNAIWLDPSKNGGEKLQITAANTSITMEGGYGGNGIAIQKTDRWGENSKESTQGGYITIQGNVNIKGVDAEGNADWGIGANPTNVLSRFNNAGILVDVNNSSVEVNGNVDMDVYGNGVTVIGDNSTVTLKKGGTITVPTGTAYGYYALAAYDGAINMNADATANTVKLDGDIFVTSEGEVNLGLVTKDSYLKGVIDNGGIANVILQNGAEWTNEANNTRYYQDNEDKGSNGRSHVTKLTGGTSFDDAGTIIQTANSDNLYIDNFTGAVKVRYDSYDVGETVTVDGGNVTIDAAETGSLVGIYARNNGISAEDTETVTAVLNALANKLYYNGYMQRGTTLQGYVTIGEGITSSSITNNYAKEITFTEHGQGTTTGEGTGINPDGGVENQPGEGDGAGDTVEPFDPIPNITGREGNENANAIVQEGTVDKAIDLGYIHTTHSIGTGEGATNNAIYDKTLDDYPLRYDYQANNQPCHFYYFDANQVINITKSEVGNAKEDVLAAFYNVAPVVDGKKFEMRDSNTGSVLQVQVDAEDNVKPVGIYVSDGSYSYLSGQTINVLTKTSSEKLKTNAIWMEPTDVGDVYLGISAKNGLNINMQGGYGGNAVAIVRSDGKKNVESAAELSLTGQVNIKGTKDDEWGIVADRENFDARTNNSGFLVAVDNAVITGDFSFDIDVYGNGVTVDGDDAKFQTTGGSNYKIVVPQGTDYNYYALAAYDGRIVVNRNYDRYATSDNTQYQYEIGSAKGTPQINGNIYAGGTASVYLGLNGADSYLNGIIIKGSENAYTNLLLYDGAVWNNASNNNSEIGKTNHVGKLIAYSELQKNKVASAVVSGKNDTIYSPKTKISEINQNANSGDIVIDKFAGDVKVNYTLDSEAPTIIKGGSIVIYKVDNSGRKKDSIYYYDENGRAKSQSIVHNSTITLHANYVASITKENLVNVLNSLANKLYYQGYKTEEGGERNLNAYVQIGEGLTASGVTAGIFGDDGNISKDIYDPENQDTENNPKITFTDKTGFEADVKFNEVTGQGSLTGKLEDGTGIYEEDKTVEDTGDAFVKPIYGIQAEDKYWAGKGILKDGVYEFKDAVNVFKTKDYHIDGGAYHRSVGVAISSHGDLLDKDTQYKTTVNMNGNDLHITNKTTGSGASISAIENGFVEINNAGNIIIDEQGSGPTAGIFANSGGKVHIHNTDGVVSIRTIAGKSEDYAKSGAGIKTLNGVGSTCSEVIIDGLVDIVADVNTCNNEAISAVASTIEVGGGHIEAVYREDAPINAWAAIRAYSEFVSTNTAIVNVNVVKDTEGNIVGAGHNTTTIIGDFVTKGGMGSGGNISVGLNGKESSWTGNYADNKGFGVTPGMDGEVNLYMKDGATWKGFNDGEMYLTMEGEGTTWCGFNIAERVDDGGPDTKQISRFDENGNMYLETVKRETMNGGLYLTLKDGALWQNAITADQGTESKVYEFNGTSGFIDMTGDKTFVASTKFAHDSNGCDFKNTFIAENDTPQETGNLVITNYSGDTTVIYRRDSKDVTKVLGGTTTIKNASAGSNITLSTDSTGIDMTDTGKVTDVLDSLANKLYYTAYTTGEDNLKGKVQIAEGLTTASVGKYFGEIEFDKTNQGQGSMKDGSLTKLGSTPTVPPSGDEDDDKPTTPDTPTVPETPEQKPVVEEKFEGDVDSSNLDNLKNDNTFGAVVVPAELGKLDFGKLDKDEHGTDKPASEHVDIVKVEGGVKHTGTTPFVWDMDDKGLHIGGKTEVTGGTYEIQNAGDVTFKGNTDVKGDGTNEGVLKIDNKENGGTTKFEGAEGSTAPVLNVGENAKVEVSGKVDITNTNGNVAVEVAKGSTVSFGGGVIGDKDSVAIKVNGGQININANGDEKVVINGKIVLGEAPTTFKLFRMARNIVVPTDISSLALTDKDSSLNDDVHFAGGTVSNDFAMVLTNGGVWNGNSTGGVDLDVILADGGAWTGYHEEGTNNNTLDMQISNGATWTNTATTATTVDAMSGEGGFVKMSEDANAGLDINSYSGDTTFVYAHGYGKDVEDKDLIKGGDVTIKAAADGSVATMRTNNIGTSDKDEVKRVLDALAQKLTYSDVTNKDNLTGKVQIMEGMTTSSATREGLIKFDDTTGKGSLDNSKDVTIDYTGDYIYGDSETAMMKGAKSAMASTVMMWRSESNDILQRMGDLRLATEESGVWAKYYGGKYEMDAQNTNFTTNYKAYQVGYDKAVGNGWNVGVAVSHNEGDSRYDLGGEGEMTVTSLSVYGNKDYGDGRYLGLILKGSQLKNEYEVFNNDHYKLEGDFKTWGTSLSAEYGKRIEKGNGFYFDPSVELTIGHVQGKDYTATSDMLAAYGKTATMDVEQDSFNSIVGRIGFGVGQRTERASYYAKLALAHEFGGDFETSYTAEETKGTSIDFGDTWYEMQLGGTAKLNDNSLLYATYERSFGGDVTEKWRVDAGLRISF